MEVCFLIDSGYDINSTESMDRIPQEFASWIHLKSVGIQRDLAGLSWMQMDALGINWPHSESLEPIYRKIDLSDNQF